MNPSPSVRLSGQISSFQSEIWELNKSLRKSTVHQPHHLFSATTRLLLSPPARDCQRVCRLVAQFTQTARRSDCESESVSCSVLRLFSQVSDIIANKSTFE